MKILNSHREEYHSSSMVLATVNYPPAPPCQNQHHCLCSLKRQERMVGKGKSLIFNPGKSLLMGHVSRNCNTSLAHVRHVPERVQILGHKNFVSDKY